jgi:hypothetical protein
MAKRTDHQIAIDDALTKDLCSSDRIYNFMVTCARRLREQFDGDPNVVFYVKGSAALARYLERGGIHQDLIRQYCARSDWDTQLLINPLLSAQDWFAAFRGAQSELVDLLKTFEDELLVVLAESFPRNRQRMTNLDDPARRNALGKRVRTQLAGTFAQLFLDTCRREHFDQDGHDKYWELQWDNINELDADDTRKDILDLEIQAHNRAVLTWALVHPGQALANFHSVMGPVELQELRQATDRAAAETWDELERAGDEYVTLRRELILANPRVIELLRAKLMGSLGDPAFIRSLPLDVLKEPIASMSGQDQQSLGLLWQQAQQATQEAQFAMQAYESDRGDLDKERHADRTGGVAVKLMNDFAWRVIAWLNTNDQARQWLFEWCAKTIFTDNVQLARFADEHYQEIRERLTAEETGLLQAIEDRMDQQFEQYHEDLDPEEEAEEQKQAVERFAPFALVEQQKGSRRAGSILENMTIRDFYLYRLMIRCQLSNRDMEDDERLIPQAPDGVDYDKFKQQFKFRAELLDVSIPRNDTLETAEQWVRVKDQIAADPQGIPLPKGDYFIDEYMLMFREVLDKKSSSAHKFSKRLWRGCLIAEAFANELKQSGRLGPRIKAVIECFPTLGDLLSVGSAGAVVVMRMCEQLIESYDLTVDEKLRADAGTMMAAMDKALRRIVSGQLTDKTFLNLMEMFAHLGSTLYDHSSIVTDYRRAVCPDDQLAGQARTVRDAIGEAFTHAALPHRCAVVEDFAIRANPDLPEQLKHSVPLRSADIVVYTTNDGAGLLQRLPETVEKSLRVTGPGRPALDMVHHGDKIYVLVLVQPPVQHSSKPGRTVLMTIQAVIDDNQDNWFAPRYDHDIKGTLGHFRRTLPSYSEFYMQSKKKHILQELEVALTMH